MPSKKYQEVKVVALGSSGAAGRIAIGDIVVLVGEGVEGFGAHDLRRQIEADGDVGERSDVERDGIREDGGAGRNVDGGCAAKGDGVIAAGLNGSAAGAERDVGVADGERIEAELVGEADANLRAADGDVRDLAQRHAREQAKVEAVGQHRRCGPGSYPLRWRRGLALATAQRTRSKSATKANTGKQRLNMDGIPFIQKWFERKRSINADRCRRRAACFRWSRRRE